MSKKSETKWEKASGRYPHKTGLDLSDALLSLTCRHLNMQSVIAASSGDD